MENIKTWILLTSKKTKTIYLQNNKGAAKPIKIKRARTSRYGESEENSKTAKSSDCVRQPHLYEVYLDVYYRYLLGPKFGLPVVSSKKTRHTGTKSIGDELNP